MGATNFSISAELNLVWRAKARIKTVKSILKETLGIY
jgi:hypothetical protein